MERLCALQSARALLKADLAQAAVRRVRGRDGNPARNAFIGSTAGATRAMSGSEPLLALVRRGWVNPDAEPRASMQYVEYRLVDRSEEHTSELQSLMRHSYAVFCLQQTTSQKPYTTH